MEQILTNILLNSLALGLVIAVLTGVVLTVTRSATPMLRYRLLSALLLLFTAGIAVIGYSAFSTAGKSGFTATHTAVEQPLTITAGKPVPSRGPAVINDIDVVTGSLRHIIDDNARIITLAWLLIVVIKSIRMGSNLLELHYLRTRKIFPAGRHWEEEVSRLASQMGIKKAVGIMQSGLTQVPVVIGHFRPLILIPLGMITAIKPKEIELMLLHELAHIKRLDFLVNLLQNLLEVLFFFNPAILWLSALIRRERENCCDEMVLRQSGTKQTYIQALLSFREYQATTPAYAMAFARESNLVSRVRRLVNQKNASLNVAERLAMIAAIVLLCSFSLFRSPGIMSQKAAPTLAQVKGNAPAVTGRPNTGIRPVAVAATASGLIPAIDTVKKSRPAKSLKDSTNIDTDNRIDINTNTGVNISIDNKAVSKLAGSLSGTLSSVINTALDSSAHYIGKATAEPQPAPQQKTEPKEKDLTTRLMEALNKAGIETSNEEFRFHIDNRELTVNGKLQPASMHKQIISGFLKSPEDKIDFTYTRRGGYVSTHSIYNKK